MGSFTYVTGVVKVEVNGRTQEENDYILKTVLNHLPVIKGLEGELETYIIKLNGYSHWFSCDEFGDITENLIDHNGNKSRDGVLQMQDYYLIALNTKLRLRECNEVYKELQRWLRRLSKRIQVCDCIIKLYDDFDSKIIENKDDCYSKMYETVNNWSDYYFNCLYCNSI